MYKRQFQGSLQVFRLKALNCILHITLGPPQGFQGFLLALLGSGLLLATLLLLTLLLLTLLLLTLLLLALLLLTLLLLALLALLLTLLVAAGFSFEFLCKPAGFPLEVLLTTGKTIVFLFTLLSTGRIITPLTLPATQLFPGVLYILFLVTGNTVSYTHLTLPTKRIV